MNPTLLTHVGQRGGIDRSGLEFIVIRYENFFQPVHALKADHVSIAIRPNGDPPSMVAIICNTPFNRATSPSLDPSLGWTPPHWRDNMEAYSGI